MKRKHLKKWPTQKTYRAMVKNENGYSTLFLCLIIMAMIGVFFMCCSAIINVIMINEQMRQSKIASEMLMSYYNDPLEMDYGLLAYDNSKVDMKQIFEPYFKGKWQVVPKSTMADLNVFQKQVIEMGKIDFIKQGLEIVSTIGGEKTDMASNSKSLQDLQNQIDDETLKNQSSEVDPPQRRKAKHLMRKIKNLKSPSWAIQDSGSVDAQVFNQKPTWIEGSAKSLNAVERGIICAYILEQFNDYAQWQNRPESRKRKTNLCFEGGEIEYILCGHREGQANQLQICGQIFLMREAINGLFLVTNPEKRNEITAVSCLIASVFPIAEPLIQGGITILWSSMESAYEVNLLLKDHKIPVAKTCSADWYTDLDPESVSGASKGGSFGSEEKGLDYRNFLLLFLMAQSDTKTAERTMSLIDFNLKKANQGIMDWSTMVTAHQIIVIGRSGKETYVDDGYMRQKK